jgi:hypothetical protein
MNVSHADVYRLSRSDLNSFLFADVGVEASGMTLSVLSTLARLGLDPWQEAARLATLPQKAAAEGLARALVTMPASPWSDPDATAIAARLVSLLPVRGTPPTAPSAQSARPVPVSFQMTWRRAILLALLAATVGATTLSLGRQRDAALDINAFPPSTSEPPDLR